MQPSDVFLDNPQGFSCPANVSCQDRCKNLLGATSDPSPLIFLYNLTQLPPIPPGGPNIRR